ncbi:hypothetical protein DC522_28485 [Microvirga sp. KLBC 81]|nr:hypothetical protein DC522_28485 [Microvirga sp. KLBC 81]
MDNGKLAHHRRQIVGEADVATGSIRDLLWLLAVLCGWLAIIALAGGWYARKKFHGFLKAPLSEEVERQTNVWEARVSRWTILGSFMSGLSLLCLVAWIISGRLVQ